MRLPQEYQDDDNFSYANYYTPLDEIANMVQHCTFNMKYRFHRWINTIHYAKGFKKRMVQLDRNAIFLNFNYTLFLESEYKIPPEQIVYLHGNRLDKFGSLVLGHTADDDLNFQAWVHKNKNRRRYRANLKDKKGRYFANDKLAYLAFFLENETKGNWRNPIRYHAVNDAEERLEHYYADNFKNTGEVIHRHEEFFSSLGNVDEITILGHSLGEVDIPYFNRIISSVPDPTKVKWNFSYYSDADKKNITSFCRRFSIADDTTRLFTFADIAGEAPIHR